MMDALGLVAEARLAEALARDELDNPLAGRPLAPEPSLGAPEELRVAFKVLRDAGFVPEELELRRALLRLDDLLAVCADVERASGLRRERLSTELRLALRLERAGGAALARAWLAKRSAREEEAGGAAPASGPTS